MSGKSKLSWKAFILIVAIIVAAVWGLGRFSKNMYPESLSKVWIVYLKNKPTLFVYSTQTHPGKTSRYGYHLRLIDPMNGEVLSHREIVIRSWKEFKLVCLTPQSIWLKVRNDWSCYALPGFERKLNNKKFQKQILQKFPSIGEIHTIKYLETEREFEVENDVGELTRFSPAVFDDQKEPVIDLDNNKVINLDYYPILGEFFSYPLPTLHTKQGITIEVDDYNTDIRPTFRLNEPLVEMLSHDTGYSRLYAVFTPDTTCLLMNGNKRRIMQSLSKDSASIKHENVLGNKVWLNGDFLRPIKYSAETPKTRLVISYSQQVYICWNTSLDEKNNNIMLTAIEVKNMKELWTIDLSKNNIKGNYMPFQSHIIQSILITAWTKGGRFYLTGIDLKSGTLVWRFPN